MNTAARRLLPAVVTLIFSTLPTWAQDAPAAEKPNAADTAPKPPTTPQKPRDQATALKEFEAEMKEIKKWTGKQNEDDKTNITKVIMALPELTRKLSAVRTDDLPVDIASCMERLPKSFRKLAALFKDAPATEEEVNTWLANKTSDEEFMQRIQAISEEANRIGKELTEAAAKHGIEVDMNKKGPEKSGNDHPQTSE
jgi:hypothetical protein